MSRRFNIKKSKKLFLKNQDKKNFFFAYMFFNKLLNKIAKKNSKNKIFKKMMLLSIRFRKKTNTSLLNAVKNKLVPNRIPVRFISKHIGRTKNLIPVFSNERIELKNVINWFFESLKDEKQKKIYDYLLKGFLDLGQNKSNMTNIRNTYLKKVFLNKSNLRFLKNKKK